MRNKFHVKFIFLIAKSTTLAFNTQKRKEKINYLV